MSTRQTVQVNKLLAAAGLCLLLLGASCDPVDQLPVPSNSGNPGSTASQAQATLPGGRGRQSLTIFAAASLTGAFQEIGREFEANHPGVRIGYDFASSQILRTQLEHGAKADVFASADQTNMDLLAAEQLVDVNTIQVFASNALIVILPTGNPGDISSLADLAKPGVKLVLADASVPAGNYTRQVLIKMSQDTEYGDEYSNRVLQNVVSNETDVKQVVAKVELGEADAGIVYVSDAVAAAELTSIPIPARFNIVAHYPIAAVSGAAEAGLAKAFIAYISLPEGQAILVKWGFGTDVP